MAGLDALSPARRAQYESLLPEVRRSARAASNARGGFYSGAALDAETRAEADLLAKLAGSDASEQASAAEGQRNRDLEEKLKGEEIKAGKRTALVNLLGAGAGSAATLGGLAYMNKGGSGLQFLPDGKGGMLSYDPATKVFAPVSVGGGAPAAGVGGAALGEAAPTGLAALNPPGPTAMSIGAPGAYAGPAVAAPAVPAAAATPGLGASMWQNATKGGAGMIAARAGLGAAGGLAGSSLANLIAGRSSTKADIGAGAGGAAGPLAMLAKGYSNPWVLGLGALAGATGGGLLGNLFR